MTNDDMFAQAQRLAALIMQEIVSVGADDIPELLNERFGPMSIKDEEQYVQDGLELYVARKSLEKIMKMEEE